MPSVALEPRVRSPQERERPNQHHERDHQEDRHQTPPRNFSYQAYNVRGEPRGARRRRPSRRQATRSLGELAGVGAPIPLLRGAHRTAAPLTNPRPRAHASRRRRGTLVALTPPSGVGESPLGGRHNGGAPQQCDGRSPTKRNATPCSFWREQPQRGLVFVPERTIGCRGRRASWGCDFAWRP